MVFRVESFPTPQAKGRAEDLVATGGGCAASAAVAIARLGGRARLAAPLGGPAGADRIGDEILAGLAAEEVDCAHCVRLAGTPSPMSAILVAAAGERMIVNHRDERLAIARRSLSMRRERFANAQAAQFSLMQPNRARFGGCESQAWAREPLFLATPAPGRVPLGGLHSRQPLRQRSRCDSGAVPQL